jgi:hypothetical protein
MDADHAARPGRVRRLAEELEEEGFPATTWGGHESMLLIELDYALHPVVFERRIASYGSFVEPSVDPEAWHEPTDLRLTRVPVDELSVGTMRRFADGLASWVVRRQDGPDELVVFDRTAGSERDLVVLAEATGATIVQRHPSGLVRSVGDFGVIRWDGVGWHHEPPVSGWMDAVTSDVDLGERQTLDLLIGFAVHDLGARGIGSLLVYRPRDTPLRSFESRLPTPPPLDIRRAADLAPLRHVLGQVDGATVFDRSGVLCQLGVRLVPSVEAEADVEGLRGMRHTAGRRYSFDDPEATVIAVSEDGPVTVLRNGSIVGRSKPT